MSLLPERCDVVIVGGGPCGLMLGIELGRRGVSAVLVDQKPSTAFNPQANATQARTMEHFRRLGFAEEVRALGLPPDFPTDIAYYTRFATHELARFKLPSARQARESVASLSGSWSAAELPHRVAQKYVEQVLRRHAEALPSISVNYGWRLDGFAATVDGVEARVARVDDGAEATVTGSYLVGADGARSPVRRQLGFGMAGETGVVRDFVGGRMLAIYCRLPDFYDRAPHAPAWMNVCFNPQRRAFMIAVDGKGEFAFHTQLKPHENEADIAAGDAVAMVRAAIGLDVTVEVLSTATWTAGHALVAERFQRGRVLLGGDAVHLFTPMGGLGYNTAVEDAVNLGWKLAMALRGQGGPGLLASYETERRPLAIRNTGYARGFAESLGTYVPVPEIEDDTQAGEVLRRAAGDYYEAHARAEFNIPGITFGGRYDGSPIIVPDGIEPPPDAANHYEPTACPGGRAPHLWLAPETSLYDAFGFEWTLLRLGPAPDPGDGFRAGGLPLTVLDVPSPEARDLYDADLALIRPDQIVAWRGNDDRQAVEVIRRVTGFGELSV
ncbi:MAG: FAD-dependent oxidoreductase [Alphaproteobacteria bacterium]